jgi:hypothetical protein
MIQSFEYYDRTTKQFRETIFDDDAVKSIKVRMNHRAMFLNLCEWKLPLVEDLFSYFEEWCEVNLPLFYCESFSKRLKKRIYYLIIILEMCYSMKRKKEEIVKKCQNILVKSFLKNKMFFKNFNTALMLKSIPEMPHNVAQIIVDHVCCCEQQRLSNVSMTSKTFSQ